MAGADTSKVRLKLEEIAVPESLVQGNKFLKWDEDSSTATPVTLKVDAKGHFLYWKYQNKDVECLELTQVRDTRTGKYASTPKEGKLRELCDMGSKEMPLEDKTVTVVYGSDMVNLTLTNFCATSDKVAQEWCEHIMKIGHNRSALNPSPDKLLHKIYTKITLMVNREGQIPVKNIRKMFSSDKKKVETALQVAGVHSGKDDAIDPRKFTYEVFFRFYVRLVNQKEIDKLFQELGAKNKPYLRTEQLVKFLNNEQRDPRLNEILYPFYDSKQAHNIIHKFEKNREFAKKGHLSIEGLMRYLLGDDNQVDGMESYLIAQDMEQPLSHYFIKSSHNTYLTGHQFTGRSSVEMYRQVLLSGCRCVELDCWDGKGDTDPEPVITHGFTMCTDILFKDVIEAINESAFKTSDYPVILSFENHCNQKQQAKMAHYCRTIFGDKLLIDPLSDFPIESGKPLPHPSALRFKILVKNKKRKHTDASKKRAGKVKTIEEVPEVPDQNAEGSSPPSPEGKSKSSTTQVKGEDTQAKEEKRKLSRQDATDEEKPPQNKRKMSKQDSQEKVGETDGVDENGDAVNESKTGDGLDDVDEESDDSDDEEALSKEEALKKMQEKKDRGTAGEEAEAGAEMSALVNYVQPVHFSSFETSEKKNHSYEISSFVETSAMNRVKENPVEFVNYNKRQLSRIYPKGTRVDSSNFMPQIFWNCGCQLVALNYQNLDLPMQLNLGLFNVNGRTGYLLKPDFMRRKDRHFDPFAESTMDGIVAASVEVTVISGQFLSDKKVGTYVEVEMFGLPADTVRKKYKTNTVNGNGINPQYDDKSFMFEKVIMPKLAMLRITAYDDNNSRQIGHRIMPIESLRPGYRHIPLRNELYQPLLMPSVFVHIKVGDYVPKGLAGFADALANPIQYQDQIEEQIRKRTEALNKLLEEAKDIAPAITNPTPAGTTDPSSEDPTPATTSKEPPEEQPGKEPSVTPVPVSPPMPEPTTAPAAAPSDPKEAVRKPSDAPSGGVEPQPQPLNKRLPKQSRQSVMAKDSTGSGASGGMLRSVSMGTTQFQSDAFSGFSNQSGRSQSTPNLVQQEEITAATVEDIKEQRKYLKVEARLEAELQKLVKKHEKKQSKMKRKQAKEISKLKASHDKARKNREKKNVAAERKAGKSKHSTAEDVKQQCAKAMETMEQEQENELLKKQVSLEDSLIDMYRRHLLAEKELKKEHAEMLFELQIDLMTAIHEKQLKKLDGQHKKVEEDLRKMLQSKTIDEMKNISKMKKEKQEISRLKREARKKHIEQAVTERMHLNQLQEKKKKEMKEKMKDLQQNLSEQEESIIRDVDLKYQEKIDQLVLDRKFKRLASDSNGSVTAGGILVQEVDHDHSKSSPGNGMNGISDEPKSDDSALRASKDAPAVHNGANGSLGSLGLITEMSATNGVDGGAGHVAGDVVVHASASGLNTNNSAQTHANGNVVSAAVNHTNHHREGPDLNGADQSEEEECKETGERSKVRDLCPIPINAIVESTRL